MGYKENFSAYSLGGNCPKKIWKLAGLLLHFWLKNKVFLPEIDFFSRQIGFACFTRRYLPPPSGGKENPLWDERLVMRICKIR